MDREEEGVVDGADEVVSVILIQSSVCSLIWPNGRYSSSLLLSLSCVARHFDLQVDSKLALVAALLPIS